MSRLFSCTSQAEPFLAAKPELSMWYNLWSTSCSISSAVRGDFTPSKEPPANYDLTQLPINEWPRLLQWIDSWTLSINDSTAILRKTSDERRKGLDGLDWLHAAILQEPSAVGTHGSSLSPTSPHEPTTRKSRNRTDCKGKRRASLTLEDEGSAVDGESQGNSEEGEVDYECLDQTPQDESSDDELYNSYHGGRDSTGFHAREDTGGDAEVLTELDRLDAHAGPGTSGES